MQKNRLSQIVANSIVSTIRPLETSSSLSEMTCVYGMRCSYARPVMRSLRHARFAYLWNPIKLLGKIFAPVRSSSIETAALSVPLFLMTTIYFRSLMIIGPLSRVFCLPNTSARPHARTPAPLTLFLHLAHAHFRGCAIMNKYKLPPLEHPQAHAHAPTDQPLDSGDQTAAAAAAAVPSVDGNDAAHGAFPVSVAASGEAFKNAAFGHKQHAPPPSTSSSQSTTTTTATATTTTATPPNSSTKPPRTRRLTKDYAGFVRDFNYMKPYARRPDGSYAPDTLCVLCRRLPPMLVFFPCQHRCVCDACIQTYDISPDPTRSTAAWR